MVVVGAIVVVDIAVAVVIGVDATGGVDAGDVPAGSLPHATVTGKEAAATNNNKMRRVPEYLLPTTRLSPARLPSARVRGPYGDIES